MPIVPVPTSGDSDPPKLLVNALELITPVIYIPSWIPWLRVLGLGVVVIVIMVLVRVCALGLPVL